MRCLAIGLCLVLGGCYSGMRTDGDSAGASETEGPGSAGSTPSGGSDGDESGGETGDPGEPDRSFERAELRRLTVAQWHQSVTDLLGDGVILPGDLEDLVEELFSTVGASSVSTSQLEVERYERAALDAAAQVFGDEAWRNDLLGCVPAAADDACASTFLLAFTRRAWRRPMTDDELTRYLQLASDNEDLYQDPHAGLQLAVAAVLQSPNFLYLVEVGEPDPDDPGRWRYTDFEMAGRLAAFLWNSVPDDELMDAAEAGELTDPAQVEAHALRMLDDPRADATTIDFFDEYLHLDALGSLVKDPDVYPGVGPDLLFAMGDEVRRIVADIVVDRDADYRELLTTRRTFINAELADLYGLPAPTQTDAAGFGQVDIPEDWTRAGLLGTGAFLATNARVTRTSPTLRGLYIQKRLLCNTIPPPPDDVDAELPDIDESQPMTMRERLAEHATNPTCAGCHDFIDPLGLPLEHFDGAGRHREDDQGLPLDVSGTLDDVGFVGLKGLAQAVADGPDAMNCVSRQVYRYANGHVEGPDERDIVDVAHASFEAADRRFTGLVVAVATSEGFRYLGPSEEE